MFKICAINLILNLFLIEKDKCKICLNVNIPYKESRNNVWRQVLKWLVTITVTILKDLKGWESQAN